MHAKARIRPGGRDGDQASAPRPGGRSVEGGPLPEYRPSLRIKQPPFPRVTRLVGALPIVPLPLRLPLVDFEKLQDTRRGQVHRLSNPKASRSVVRGARTKG